MNEDVKQITTTELEQRTAEFEKELKDLEQRFQLRTNVSLEFPHYRILPDEVKLALAVLNTHKFVFQRSYTDLRGEANNANIS